MEFHEKLQELRKRKGLTQEGLAAALFVSRAAISKWESGRGYPGIDSLKAMAAYFSVTVDFLLSGGEALTIAEEDSKQKQDHFRDLAFGLLDCGNAMFLFLPLFGQGSGDTVRAVSLLALTDAAAYLRAGYFGAVIAMVTVGILLLALQNCRQPIWLKSKTALSLGVHTAAVLLFILSRQPYGAAFAFLFLAIKVLMLIKKP